jgi:hypothetical protein
MGWMGHGWLGRGRVLLGDYWGWLSGGRRLEGGQARGRHCRSIFWRLVLRLGMEFVDNQFTGILSLRCGGYKDRLACGFTTGMGVCMTTEVWEMLISG